MPIAVLSAVENLRQIETDMQQGAVGYIPKSKPMESLQQAATLKRLLHFGSQRRVSFHSVITSHMFALTDGVCYSCFL